MTPVCPTCLGLKVLVCLCDNYNSFIVSDCDYCHGKGVIPCHMCKGGEMIICPQCEGEPIPKKWVGYCGKCLGSGVVPK